MHACTIFPKNFNQIHLVELSAIVIPYRENVIELYVFQNELLTLVHKHNFITAAEHVSGA